MSRMDSQLLATGSLVTRDLAPKGVSGIWSRESVIVSLAVLGLLLSLWSDLSILDLGLLAFSMYAVMFPSVFAASHFDDIDGRAVIASIAAGESVVLLAVFSPESFDGWWVEPVKGAVPTAVIPSLVAAIVGLVSVQYACNRKVGLDWFGQIFSVEIAPMLGLVAVFVLAQDFWWWEDSETWAWGLPKWIWWAALLSMVQTGIIAKWLVKEEAR